MKTLIAAMACLLLLPLSTLAGSGKVYVYNWTEYIPEEVLTRFTEETGIEVVYSTYDSNEAMYSKLKLVGSKGYDLIFPSTYFVSRMSREGMLQPLDRELLPNLAGVDPALLGKPYDPGNVYSLPYMWGSTGIGVNSDLVEAAGITGWKDLWNPAYRGQVLLQDDLREVFHMALKIKGYSSNSTDPEEIEQAYELLRELLPNVLLFNSDSPRLPYLAGEVSVGMIWNGEAWMARQENQAIRYIYPEEGANFWVDSFAIPAGAENVENAHAFIDFMLRPEIAKICVEENGFATPVLAALPLLDEAVRNSEIIFPPAAVIEAGEFQTDVGEALAVYQRFWEQLRTGTN